MSQLWRKWYKVDELHTEIRNLKKRVKELESDNRMLNLKALTGDYPHHQQAYESMENREFLSKPENQPPENYGPKK